PGRRRGTRRRPAEPPPGPAATCARKTWWGWPPSPFANGPGLRGPMWAAPRRTRGSGGRRRGPEATAPGPPANRGPTRGSRTLAPSPDRTLTGHHGRLWKATARTKLVRRRERQGHGQRATDATRA